MRFIIIPTHFFPIRIIQFLCVAGAVLTSVSAIACTSFCLNETSGPVVGANFDWPVPDGMIVINKQGFYKTALSDPDKDLNPVSWKSRYGSVTFNFLGIDWPWGGMNQAGLVITTMQLEETRYPQPDERPSIHMAQWVQYQLDRFATVRQVIHNGDRLRIRNNNNQPGLHYMVVDPSGDCAVVEFMDGRRVVHTKAQLPLKALANDPYARSLQNTKNFKGFGGRRPIPDGNISYGRFLRAAAMLHRPKGGPSSPPIDHGFEILDHVRFNNHPYVHTQWSAVFDIRARRILFKTHHHPKIRSIDIGAFDYSCSAPVKTMDIQHPLSKGGIEAFQDYDRHINRLGFQRAFPKHPMKAKRHESRLDRMSRYPETFVCEER